MDNTHKQVVVLAKINELTEMQIILADKKIKLREELNKLEEENKKNK